MLGAPGGVVGLAMDFSFVWLGLQALLVFVYFAVLDATIGTTLGKRLLGLRVTGPAGGIPTLGQAAAREAFNSSPTGQGVHDTIARGTAVVRA